MNIEKSYKRIIITELILENFKSYKGIKTIGRFHENFTSIIGPNGSGKSNIIDALLFVFGKKANKLRLKSLTELISNIELKEGESTLLPARPKESKVTVKFEEIMNQDINEFKISRVVTIENKSYYYINDDKVTFTELIKLLKEKGIDMSQNRFLILQGEVEQISQMKPRRKQDNKNETGLLEYIEEIIGSDRYIEEIENQYKKIEEVSEEKDAVKLTIKALLKENDDLKPKKDRAELYLKKESEITSIKINEINYKIYKKQNELEKLKKEIEEMNLKLGGDNEEIKRMEVDKEGIEGEMKMENNKILELKVILDEIKGELNGIENERIKLNNNLKNTDEQINKINTNIKNKRKEKENKEKEINEVRSKGPEIALNLEKIINELNEEKIKLEKLKERYGNEIGSYEEVLRKLRYEKDPYDIKILNIKQELKQKENEKVMEMERKSKLKSEHEKLINNKKELDIKKENFEEKLNNLNLKKENFNKELEEIKCKIENNILKEKEITNKIRSISYDIEKNKNEYNKEKSKNEKMKLLKKAVKNNQLKNIYGRLGDLGTIEAKYDIAISSALNTRLNYIVVETTEDAQACSKFFKDKKLGPSTFLIRQHQDHLKYNNNNNNIRFPENIPRIFDCIKIKEEKLKVAFYAITRDMFVANDIEQATRIAFRNGKIYSAVTLNGDVISGNGTMTGGSCNVNKKLRGLILINDENNNDMRIDELDELDEDDFIREIEKLNIIKNKLNEELMGIKMELDAFKVRNEEIMIEVKNEKIERRNLETDYKLVMENLKEIEIQLNVVNEKIKDNEKEDINDFEDCINNLKNKIKKIEEEMSPLSEKMREIEDQIENIGSGEIREKNENIKKLKKKFEEKEKEKLNKMAVLETKEPMVKEIENEIKRKEDKRVNLEENKIELREKIEENEANKLKKTEQEKEISLNLNNKNKSYQEIKKNYEGIHEKINKLKEKENELRNEYENKNKKYNNENKEMDKCKEIKLNLINKFKEMTNGKKIKEENIKEYDYNENQKLLKKLQKEISELKDIDLTSIEKYYKLQQELEENQIKLDNTKEELNKMTDNYINMKYKRLKEFREGLEQINYKLKQVYRSITDGGDVEIEPLDSFDPFTEGLVFSVRPPKKTWKIMKYLSGGEKTLSSLSLIFALHAFKPTPFYIMDEIDAALDYKNVSIVGQYISDQTKDVQFIVVSLRPQMFELSKCQIGVYKISNISYTAKLDKSYYKLRNDDDDVVLKSRKRSLSVSPLEVTRNMRKLSLTPSTHNLNDAFEDSQNMQFQEN